METGKEHISLMEKLPETSPVAAYLQLLMWMKSKEINKEDLALACQIFLLINE